MNDNKRTGRITGLWYLSLALFGMLGFLIVRPQLYVDNPAETLANITDNQGLARLGVGFEMALVVTQSLAAVWFYKLFRSIRPVAAFATAAFGLVNAVAIMMSGAFMTVAIAVTQDPSLAPSGDAAATVGLLGELSLASWGMGNLFFGLWLIPMGWVAIATGRFPRVLGWILVVGGAGYVLSGFLTYAFDGVPTAVADSPAYFATVGEFWMIAYLLIKGIRPAKSDAVTA